MASDSSPKSVQVSSTQTWTEHKKPALSTRTPLKNVWIQQGSQDYYRAGFALFLLGFASFSLIYCVQPLLPAFSHSFNISPATSSLALSLTTGLLAFSIVLASAFSQAVGRRGIMFFSMAIASVLNIIASFMQDWHALLIARALEGLVLGGVPAVAMAWLAEEIDPAHLGKAMGLYVGGTAFGAMIGRVGMGLMSEFYSWRIALEVLGVICLAFSFGFYKLLPESRNFVAQPGFRIAFHLRTWAKHLRNVGLIRLYAIGFCLTSIFVTLFNYATFRLSDAPYSFSQTTISLIFLVYAFGVVSSSIAGSLADRFGKRPLMFSGFAIMGLGIVFTLASSIISVIAGVILVTTGFFISHSVTSGCVGPTARENKGHAASLYLLFYYMGSSIIGSVGGWFWLHGGWIAIVALTLCFATLGSILSLLQIKR
ncbi:MFS transporter [Acinetobacter sp. MB5]|uniref:MFS transporter n=1 Tax=Acinetobacter sp. MB5 TaxID=2069438 RepID=UPI000DD01D71|nr:MFS transporter [Acinetobacter sp. MB5]